MTSPIWPISFCRALNIPARYVFGYLPDMDVPPDPAPMDFAAWMEVWLGDRWWTFDPRNNMPRKGRIVIGRGRDASDVAMATTFGGPRLESMVVQAEEAKPPGASEPRSLGPARPGARSRGLDLAAARRVSYVLEQSFRYEYDAPVESLRQRLVIVPPVRHGQQHLRAHHLEVTGAKARRRVRRDAAGNVVAWLRADYVPAAIEFRLTAVLERVRDDGPAVLPAAALHSPRLLRPTRLTAPDERLRAMAADITAGPGPAGPRTSPSGSAPPCPRRSPTSTGSPR